MLTTAIIVAAVALIVAVFVFAFRKRGPQCDVPLVHFEEGKHWLLGLLKVPPIDWPDLFLKKSRECGPILRVRSIPWLTASEGIFVCDVNVIKEMLLSKDFANRPPVMDAGQMLINPRKRGILLQDWTPAWKNLHKVTISILNSFGFGKMSMETKILQEADALVEAMLSLKEPFQPMDLIRVAVSNVISKMVFDERTEINQKSELHEAIFVAGLAMFDLGTEPLYLFTPWLVHWYKTPKAKKIWEAVNVIRNHVRESVKRHEETLDEADEPRDFIDAFIRERRKHPGEEHPGEENLSEENMMLSINDLFQAGTDTTSSLMSWTIVWLLHHPEIGDKLRRELNEEFGSDGLPSMTHLPKLHYLRAFMDEVLRLSNVTQFSLPHRCVEESAKIRGYTITNDKIIAMCLHACHKNPDVWGEDVDEFKPQRFLNEEGKYEKSKNLIPFGYGNRHCMGERLATMEQFLSQLVSFRDSTSAPRVLCPNGRERSSSSTCHAPLASPSPAERSKTRKRPRRSMLFVDFKFL